MSDLRDKRQGANDPVVGKALLPEGLLRQRMAPYSNRPGGAEKHSRQRPALKSENDRVQRKQGGHHMPPKQDDGPPLDDTDRNTDKVIKPGQRRPRRN